MSCDDEQRDILESMVPNGGYPDGLADHSTLKW